LFGAASLLAATAIKDWINKNNIKARVRYYRCPTEEGGAAKTYMDAGGNAANVVQAKATIRHLIRASDLVELRSLVDRVYKIADGAALMTQTRVEKNFIVEFVIYWAIEL
jgi:metal-dependent amidase/aminoacylase/carboxypeptidase family protein